MSDPDAAPVLPAADDAGASRDVLTGYAFAAIGAVLFSSKGIVIKLAYEEGISPEALLALRMVLALPVYFVIGGLAVRDRRRRGAALPSAQLVLKAALVGMLGYWCASYMDFIGLSLISAQFERLILFTYPLFVVVFGALFFKLPVQRRALAAFALSYAGLALIFTAKFAILGKDVVLGAGFVVVAARAFAFYEWFAKGLIGYIGPRLFTCIAMTAAGIMAIGQFLLVEPVSSLAVSPLLFGYGVLLAIGATVLPSFFLNAALHRISAQANATIGTLSPVATIIMAVFILGEVLTMRDMIGTALVLGGVGWFTLGGRRQAPA
jgi:drug/metabolite transporter (DMT)-like permease